MPYPMDDVIVVLPGIMGSTLYRDGQPVWEPSRGGLAAALTTLSRSVTSLRLPEGVGDSHPGDGVEAVDLMPDIRLPFGIWTFDLGYSALLRFLRRTFDLVEAAQDNDPANLVTFAYDWRLSNRYNGVRLRSVAENALARWRHQGGRFADAKLVFIAHSMGGLVARWYLDRLGGAELTRKVITLGTPHRGALNALEQLCNGVRKGPGPLKLNLTRFALSLPTLYQLLPEYACIEHSGTLAKTTEVQLPELATAMVVDAMEFHNQIDAGRVERVLRRSDAYELHPICGFKQPTWITARQEVGRIVGIRAIGGRDDGGDATVPRLSAVPPDVRGDSAVISHIADNHGGLVHNQNVFDELEGILTASPVRYRGGDIRLSVDMEEVLDSGEPLHIRAALPDGDRVTLTAVVADEGGRPVENVRLRRAEDVHIAVLTLPGPGVYRVTVQGVGAAFHQVSPVTTAVLAWPQESSFNATDLDS